jgi:aryl-alcohol dehydrogenase-like predicted oxidoreductase
MSTPFHPDPVSRRDFLKAATAGAALAAAVTTPVAAADKPAKLPQKVLGKTGVSVPVLGLGTAPAGRLTEREAVAFFNRCIDAGVTYLDTAPEFTGYGKAQRYLAPVLKDRRHEVFVVTKCFEPDGEKALALLKQNLAELGIERADLVYAHSLGDDKMVPEKIYAADGVCKALEKAKRDGLTRFVGVSGHNRPARFVRALREWDYDVQMNAVSLVARHVYDFESKVWPLAAEKKVGLAAMKVYGGFPGRGPWNARMPAELRSAALRYALGLPPVTVAVVGMKGEEELKQNLAVVRDFKPLSAEELAALEGPTRDLARQWGTLYGAVA